MSSSTTTKNRNRFSLILQLASAHKPSDNSNKSVTSPTASSSRTSLRFGRSSSNTPSTTPPRSNVRASSDPRSPPPSSVSAPAAPSVVTPDVRPLPSTTNELDAGEKMKLLKKARKISQVFGEVPLGTAPEECKLGEVPEGDNVGKASVGKASARRMKTLSWGPNHPQSSKPSSPSVDLLKAIVSPRPSVHTSSPKASPGHTPAPSIRTDASNATKSRRPSVESSRSTPRRSSESTRHTPTKRPERSRSASATRSNRHLGETASETALLSHADEGAQSDSTHTSSAPLLQANSTSARRVLSKDKWRRKSLDLSFRELTMSPNKPSSAVPTDERPSTQPVSSLRRSKSAWGEKAPQPVKKPEERALERAAIIEDLKGGAFGTPGPLTDKQRALNVRRARKLVQLFGSEPPPALYQVSTAHIEAVSTPDKQKRDSIVTILSVARSNDLLSTQAAREAKHRSYSSISSISSEPSSSTSHAPLVQVEKGRKSESDSVSNPQPPSIAESPRTSFVADVEDLAAFRQRRLRAAKLSRFFGVNYHDLSQTGLDAPSVAPTPSRTSAVASMSNRPTSPKADLDVRIDQPGGFWALMDGRDNRAADMNDVIGKLRQMRVAT